MTNNLMFATDKPKHALINRYKTPERTPTQARIMAAIATAKNIGVLDMAASVAQEWLDDIAEKFKLEAMQIQSNGTIAGWTAKQHLIA